jgi:hypothetical protein
VISWFQAFAFKWVNLCRYIVADGQTYYELFNQLSSGVEAAAINPVRKEAFSENFKEYVVGTVQVEFS